MKKGILLSVVMVFMLFFSFNAEVNAGDKLTFEVGVDKVNLRSSPSHDAKIVGSLERGDKLAVFEKKYGWYQTYYHGELVWIASQFLIARSSVQTSKAVKKTPTELTIVGDGVRIRTGPGTDNKIQRIADNGDTYELMETNQDWHKIRDSNNQVGWVASWLTSNLTTEANQVKKSSTTIQSKPMIKSLTGYNIILDAGHGGIDPGAISLNNDAEKDLVLRLTKRVAEKLRSEGATVILTRADDSYVSLAERAEISNNYWAHAFISLHFNAFTSGKVNGISTHYYNGNDSLLLSKLMQESFMHYTELSDRGVSQDNFYVLRETNTVSVLAELGFLTNPSDLQVIEQNSYAEDVASAIADSLKSYFYIKK